jgi:hypothetical protein
MGKVIISDRLGTFQLMRKSTAGAIG